MKPALLGLGFSILFGAQALAQDATDRANRIAYDIALKCFEAYGVARGDANDAGQKATASAFETKARQSFDIASKLGNALGLSGNRISQDFSLAETQELPRMVKDKVYLRSSIRYCGSAGL